AHNGIMQPILVRPLDEAGEYEIVAGERRWRAAKLADLQTVPVLIREMSDQTALELAIVENIQRADLSPVEEAAGYQRLMDEFQYTQEELAETVGKSRSHVANLLRLLALPDEIKIMATYRWVTPVLC
ncbi:MAG: ParB/RepB/Spo0J family partition protein, partial [Rickettsiales bacterium]